MDAGDPLPRYYGPRSPVVEMVEQYMRLQGCSAPTTAGSGLLGYAGIGPEHPSGERRRAERPQDRIELSNVRGGSSRRSRADSASALRPEGDRSTATRRSPPGATATRKRSNCGTARRDRGDHSCTNTSNRGDGRAGLLQACRREGLDVAPHVKTSLAPWLEGRLHLPDRAG